MQSAPRRCLKGFSLVELVIVVVMIGIIAAIAIPRMSRGAAGAADSSLMGDLATMRKAIDMYATEHGGTYPTAANITNQLTKYTDDQGAAQASKDATHLYGPYLRSVPPLPVGAQKGNTGITDTQDTAGFGWVYNESSGRISANTANAELDATSKAYNGY
jgi:prepilin-type N-terminal cleavage/methylation domain-containing protein